jgi:soluble lytic murein transglycosylase-like protein
MVLLAAVLLLPASVARADTLFFTNGRTMSVKTARVDGGVITVRLPHGGQATFDASIVARIAPSEVPDEEETAAVAQEAAPTRPILRATDLTLATRPFAALIHRVARENQVDPLLVHAVVQVESNYEPRARSRAGARGLMQVMPGTGADLGVRNLYDPQSNLEAGVRYLKSLMGQFTLGQALAAYNAGPANVRKYGGIPPFPDTQDYVKKVLSSLPARP